MTLKWPLEHLSRDRPPIVTNRIHPFMNFLFPLKHCAPTLLHVFQTRRNGCKHEVTSMGFIPLWRFSAIWSNLCEDVQTSTMFRLQVFSTSWRFIPQITYQPYFMPNTFIGFPVRASVFRPPVQRYHCLFPHVVRLKSTVAIRHPERYRKLNSLYYPHLQGIDDSRKLERSCKQKSSQAL